MSFHNSDTPLTYEDLPRLIAIMTGDEKHAISASTTLEVLWTLYDRVLRVDPTRPDDPARDRFLLSKGHGPMAYYAVLAAKGFFPIADLQTFARYDSPLGTHPDRNLIRGVEISSGSLGHGMGLAVGMALALRSQGRHRPRIFCLVGDGELDEGSNHEAIAFAARARLDRITVIVIDNRSATHGWPGGIAQRFETEGWSTVTVDGRDREAIHAAVAAPHPGRPHAVVAEVVQ